MRLAGAGLVVLTAWAGMTEIDQVKRAQGQVIASDRTQIIQAVDGGVLRELFVQEGQEVKEGQLLASFEKTRVKAALEPAGTPGQAPPRIGLRGTAKILGDRVPLALYLFRRPLALLRQSLGI